MHVTLKHSAGPGEQKRSEAATFRDWKMMLVHRAWSPGTIEERAFAEPVQKQHESDLEIHMVLSRDP